MAGAGGGEEMGGGEIHYLHGSNSEPAASSLELSLHHSTEQEQTLPASKGAQKIRGQRQNEKHK